MAPPNDPELGGQILTLLHEMRGELSTYAAESRMRHGSSEAQIASLGGTLGQLEGRLRQVETRPDPTALESRLRGVEVAVATNATKQDTRWSTWGPIVAIVVSAAITFAAKLIH